MGREMNAECLFFHQGGQGMHIFCPSFNFCLAGYIKDTVSELQDIGMPTLPKKGQRDSSGQCSSF